MRARSPSKADRAGLGLPPRDGAARARPRRDRRRARRRAGEPRGIQAPPADDLVPAPEQAAAVRAAFASRLSIVTGGPGTGKTATIRLICAAAAEQKASILLVAPTGRAARRMSESSGLDASTVHSALGWIPDQGPRSTSSRPTS